MKKIRIDYYHYRLKKGRADILLQKDDETGGYCIPFHYGKEDEHLFLGSSRYKRYKYEDDGDLVLIDSSLNESRLKRNEKEWIPLDRISGLKLKRNEFLHVSHNILSLFLGLCPREVESRLYRKVEDMLETVKVDIAKKKYIEELRRVLKGERRIVIPDASVKQPDPELVRKEMETLEHFRLYKPHPVSMNQRDGDLKDSGLYSYEAIDWEELGAEITPLPFLIDLAHKKDWVEENQEAAS